MMNLPFPVGSVRICVPFVLDDHPHQVGKGRDAQFSHDTTATVLNGPFRDMELLSDLLVQSAASHEYEHAVFIVAQTLDKSLNPLTFRLFLER